jgi:hypothetical protein
MNADTGVGAPSYTSGVQKWNGTGSDLEREADDQKPDAGEAPSASLRSSRTASLNAAMISS